jgi:Uncharacterized protein conserved in bacteria
LAGKTDSKNPPRDPSFDPQIIPEDRDPQGEVFDDPEAAAAEQRGALAEDERLEDDIDIPSGTQPPGRDLDEEQSARRFAQHSAEEEHNAPLLAPEHAAPLRAQWDAIQTAFVDEPRRAVQDADHLVAQAMARLADTFAQERANLEQQWGRGQEASTEDLRQALRRYRSFFQRLLSV